MANIKVSELPAASAASTSQEFEVNDSGTSKKVTGSQIKSFVKSGLVLTDITDVTASVAELNALDGITATAAELNVLDGASTSQAPLILAQPSAFIDPENRIINGAFDLWQRATSHSTNGYGSADRWSLSFSGGTVTMSRQAFALGDTLGSNNPIYFLRQTVSGQTLSTQNAVFAQAIEGVRSYAGQTITILGWARRSSGSGNMAVECYQFMGYGGSPSSDVPAIGVTTVTLTGSFAPFAVTMNIPSISGKTLGTNNNDQLALNFWTSAGSNFNARTNSLGLQTIGVDLWGIHIKVGTHTTDAVNLYKQPELGPELARCQRYYFKSQFDHSAYANVSTAQFRSPIPFPVAMRATPTLTLGTATSNSLVSTAAITALNEVVGSSFIQTSAAGNARYAAPFTASSEI